MSYEETRSIIKTICIASGAFLLIMNTYILCLIVPLIGYHLLPDEATTAWLPIAHIFGLFIVIFVIALSFLFAIDLVQYLDKVKMKSKRNVIKE